MFNIDATFEDCRIQAGSDDGKSWKMAVIDQHKGDVSPVITVTPQQLDYILRMNLDADGMPEGYEQMYEVLEPLFKDWPTNLRPIP